MNCSPLLGIFSIALIFLTTPVLAQGETVSEQIRSSVNPQGCLWLPGFGTYCF